MLISFISFITGFTLVLGIYLFRLLVESFNKHRQSHAIEEAKMFDLGGKIINLSQRINKLEGKNG